MLPAISDTALNSLAEAALQIQTALQDRGYEFDVESISTALSRWLEQSIEQLCDDTAFHCVEGDRTYAFNQEGFNRILNKLPELLEEEAETIRLLQNQVAIAVERVA
jgi:hypothetical protein